MIFRRASLLRLSMLLYLAAITSASLSAQKQEFDNRFEGAFINNGNGKFEVIGVLRAPVEFTPQESIWVKFSLPPGKLPDAGVQIEAQELVDLHAYFMKSKSFTVTAGTWNRFGPWPASAVLAPKEIEPANLTVTASYVDDTGTRIYLPVLARGDNFPPSNTYTFQFRVASNIHSLQKSLIAPDGKTASLPTSECTFSPTCIMYDAGTPHEAVLDMTSYQNGRYQLHLEGTVPGSTQPVKATITFYHAKF